MRGSALKGGLFHKGPQNELWGLGDTMAALTISEATEILS